MISMKVINAEETDGLMPHAVFILPYRLFGRDRIMVFEGMVTPCIHLNRGGLHGYGSNSFLEETKDFEVVYNDSVQRQVDGFLTLLRMTEGHPVSIVRVKNPLNLLPQLILQDITEAYRDRFMDENREIFDELRPRAVETAMNACYNLRTWDGLKRRVRNTTVTSYYGVPVEVLRMMGEITHPGRELNSGSIYTPPKE